MHDPKQLFVHACVELLLLYLDLKNKLLFEFVIDKSNLKKNKIIGGLDGLKFENKISISSIFDNVLYE